MMNTREGDYRQAVFIDETAFSAFMDPDHPRYTKARSFFMDLDDLDRHFVCTNYVIFHTHQWLRDRHGYEHATFFLDTIEKTVDKGRMSVLPGSAEIERQSRQLLKDHPELQYTLNEAVTAVVLSTYQIDRIFTFNPGFMLLQKIIPGMKVIPSSL